jgi:hypothetical protein
MDWFDGTAGRLLGFFAYISKAPCSYPFAAAGLHGSATIIVHLPAQMHAHLNEGNDLAQLALAAALKKRQRNLVTA